MDTESLRVDLADMDDVRAQLPRAREILERKRIALERSQADHDSFRELVALLAKRVGVDLDDSAPTDRADLAGDSPQRRSDALSAVVELVNRENRPIRARDVQEILTREGHALVGDAVRDALYYAAKRREPPLIQSLPERGYYAPLSYQPEEAEMFSGASTGEADPEAMAQEAGP
jgi:hypothetical protein